MKVLFLALTLVTANAFAEEKGENLETMKSAIAANIDQRISAMQAHKSCVQGASSKEALKGCRESHKEAMRKLKDENKGERAEWKKKFKERREEKKKKS